MVQVYFIFLISLLFSSCASLEGVVSDAELLSKLELNKEGVHSFRGSAYLSFSLNHKKGAVDFLILADSKGNLRMETGSFIGFPLSAMTIYQKKVTYYAIPEEKVYTGGSSLVPQALPFHLTEEELRGLLFFSKKTYVDLKKREQFKLEVFGLKEDESTHFYYPSALRLTYLKTQEYITLRWDGVDLNPSAFSSALFKLDIPPQARIYQWKEGRMTPLLQGSEEEEN